MAGPISFIRSSFLTTTCLARQLARIISPEPEVQKPPKEQKNAGGPKDGGEYLITKKHGKGDTVTGSKRKAEGAGDQCQQTEQPTQKRDRPAPEMRLVPSETKTGPPPTPSYNSTNNSSNALEPDASREVPNPISPCDLPNVEPNEEHWPSCGEEDNKNVAHPAKAVPPSDHPLRKRC
ncbi:hypothetical protein RhiJN_26585 [Ceratobasidium sp. AG-Ba]|nr:hypothetical protein RhiJN_12526 [Ceratobasidium sp. AG-Ba]QRV98566.1 hypothetical protein RhiJN_26585 [Ceratobasidium sp. AG-Ba]